VPVTVEPVPVANVVYTVEPLPWYDSVQFARFGLLTVPVTVVTAVTSAASTGLVIVTTGAAPVTGPSTRNPPPLGVDAISVPVVTVIGARNPGVALLAMVKFAVAVVALVTVIGPKAPTVAPPTEIPAPKFATEVPFTKCVNAPDMVTVTA